MRRPAASLATVLAVVVVALAGCSNPLGGGGGTDDLHAEVMALEFPVMLVRPTPAEAFEKPGDSVLKWEGEFFGILSRDPAAGLRAMTVINGDTAYSSDRGIGWFMEPYPGGTSKSPSTTHMILWNLKELVTYPDLSIAVRRNGPEANYTLTGSPLIAGHQVPLTLQLGARDGTVTFGRLTAPDIPETPFMFSVGGTLPFPLAVPENVLNTVAAVAKQKVSITQHSFLVQLIHNYTRNHAGMVPPSVDADTLRLELLTTGKSWPVNPFDGEPLRSELKSGHFNWCTKGANVGAYTSYGFDDVLGHMPFGARCP